MRAWEQDDEEWFVEHQEEYRVRDAFPDEMDALLREGDGFQLHCVRCLREAANDVTVTQDVFRMIIFRLTASRRYKIPLLGHHANLDEPVILFDPTHAVSVGAEEALSELRQHFAASSFPPSSILYTLCDHKFETGEFTVMIKTKFQPRNVCVRCAENCRSQCVTAAIFLDKVHESTPIDQWPTDARERFEEARQIIDLARSHDQLS